MASECSCLDNRGGKGPFTFVYSFSMFDYFSQFLLQTCSHATQAGLELVIWPSLTLNS